MLKPAQVQIRYLSKFDVYSKSRIPAKKERFIPKSGTYPKGFQAGSIDVGIEPTNKSQPELVLITSEKPSCGAAVFTKNEFPTTSTTISKDLLRKTKGHGLRVSSPIHVAPILLPGRLDLKMQLR